MKLSWKFLLSPLLLLTFASLAHAQSREVIVYGLNTPQWNQKLGVTSTRSSCNLSPEGCVQVIPKLLNSQGTVRFYLNILDAPDILNRTAYYSQASLSEPRLYELDIDDFIDHFNGWCHRPGVSCTALLAQVIANTKSRNPALKFGVTLYEDQLASLLANPQFTPQLRGEIDTIHLYMHLRQDGPHFESYVNTIRHAFPNAQVIGGAYPYDRIDYVNCGAPRCDADGERTTYQQTLKTELVLLQHGVINGIEFYPGSFGLEDKIAMFNDPRECSPERRQECIDSTKQMHQLTAELLNQNGIGGR
jgi:hypothetical protein